MREERSGRRARAIIHHPDGGRAAVTGSVIHYRMADGADDIEFTAEALDLELLMDRDGERAWLRVSHFHRVDRHGLSWLRHRLVSARVTVSASWHDEHPAWEIHDERGEMVLSLVLEEPLVDEPEPAANGKDGVRGLVWALIEGPPADEPPLEA